MNKMKCEILAPAGSFECMKAAFNAGADAVYAGGSMFGARASAQNFNREELIEALDYAHIHNKKFYLTVNTLLKDSEIGQKLYDYLKPAYEAGLDAVIVQDYGVLTFVRKYFPNLPIHASTQMNTTGIYASKGLKELGVTRIVTARELSLEEITDIYNATGLEIESFVHGALCYCHSGQCLLSSMIGGRSGNRGRCAQPCRLNYDVLEQGKQINKKEEKYILSPKDLCTLELIPSILKAGVYSLKIEGRMKKPEYVASVTAMYRKYVDLYLEKGVKGFHVSKDDIIALKDIYNRGGFTTGYYTKHNGAELMSTKKPNHCGVVIGTIEELSKNTIFIKTLLKVNKGDVLQFDIDNNVCNYTAGEDIHPNTIFQIKNRFQKGEYITERSLNSRDVIRMRNNSLIQSIEENYMKEDEKCSVMGEAVFKENHPAILKLTLSTGITVNVSSEILVTKAQNRPVTKEDIEEKLRKTGGTAFQFETLSIQCEDNIFFPLKEINELRRKAFDALYEEILTNVKRQDALPYKEQDTLTNDCDELHKNSTPSYKISASVSTAEQYRAAVNHPLTNQIYIEIASFGYDMLENVLNASPEKNIYIALPYIMRKTGISIMEEHRDIYKHSAIKGVIVRNLEEYFYLRPIFSGAFIFDNTIYCYNKEAYKHLNSYHPRYINTSLELNYNEAANLQIENAEVDVYGYEPVMVTAGCIKKTLDKCDRTTSFGNYSLTDRKKENFKVANICSECYNVIYNESPYSLLTELDDVMSLNPKSLRLNFTFEKAEEVTSILSMLSENLSSTGELREPVGCTKGHFRRGVQ